MLPTICLKLFSSSILARLNPHLGQRMVKQWLHHLMVGSCVSGMPEMASRCMVSSWTPNFLCAHCHLLPLEDSWQLAVMTASFVSGMALPASNRNKMPLEPSVLMYRSVYMPILAAYAQ